MTDNITDEESKIRIRQENRLKYFMTKFGNRDNEGFGFHVVLDGKPYNLHLQYNYDEEGELLEQSFLFQTNNKLNSNYIENADTDDIVAMCCEFMKDKYFIKLQENQGISCKEERERQGF